MASSNTQSETVLAEFALSRTMAFQWAIVGMLGFFLSLGLFGGLYSVLTSDSTPLVVQTTGLDWWLDLLVFVVLTTVIVLPHELCHGLAISFFGGTPRYGAGVAYFVLPYAYATTDTRFTRNQFILVALAPLVILTLVGVPVMVAFEWSWLAIPLAANAGGAVGDLWMVLTLLGYPSHVRIEDSATGMRILGRPDDRSTGHSATAFIWDAVVGAAVASVGVPVLVGLLVPFVLPALGIESLVLGQPGTPLSVFEYESGPRGYAFSVGFGTLIVGEHSGWRTRSCARACASDPLSANQW